MIPSLIMNRILMWCKMAPSEVSTDYILPVVMMMMVITMRRSGTLIVMLTMIYLSFLFIVFSLTRYSIN